MITLPIELFLKVACPNGQYCLWQYPALFEILNNHPDKDKLFHIEHTTAAKGPWVLWYPLEKWKEEQKMQAEIERLVSPKLNKINKLNEQIAKAKAEGNEELVETLKYVRNSL